MFSNLIESSSHQKDLARKGRFFLATLVSYALIVACAGIFSIYAYDAQLEEQEMEFLGLVNPDQFLPEAPVNRNAGPRQASNPNERARPAERTAAIDRVGEPKLIPKDVSSIGSSVPEIPKGDFKIGNVNSDAVSSGPPSNSNGDGVNGTGDGPGSVVRIDTPPPVRERPATAQPKVVRVSKLLNGDARSLPKPIYPDMAKRAGVSGPVKVQVMIDESGKVVSASATSGNPLLYRAATQAAFQARFSPTILNEVPVKVSGLIVYNFVLQ